MSFRAMAGLPATGRGGRLPGVPTPADYPAPPDIRLRPLSGGRLTDGIHRYWLDPAGRVRWARALGEWPDDGVGLSAHGSAPTLLHAVEAAEASRRRRVECGSR